jgi:transcription elongation factor Elf1
MTDDRYPARARCNNCGWRATIPIPKGDRVSGYLHRRQHIDRDLSCPFCGCDTLQPDRGGPQEDPTTAEAPAS